MATLPPLSAMIRVRVLMVARLCPATMPRNRRNHCATMTPWLRGCASKIKGLDPIFGATATIGVLPAQPPQPCLYTVRMVAGGPGENRISFLAEAKNYGQEP